MHDAFAEERQENSRVLWVAYQGVGTSCSQSSLLLCPVDFTPAGDQQQDSEKDDRVTNGHRDEHRLRSARQVDPEVAVPEGPRDIQVEDASQQINCDGETIHLGV